MEGSLNDNENRGGNRTSQTTVVALISGLVSARVII